MELDIRKIQTVEYATRMIPVENITEKIRDNLSKIYDELTQTKAGFIYPQDLVDEYYRDHHE